MDKQQLDSVRNASLKAMARNEIWFKFLLVGCSVAEIIGLVAVFWLIDWSDPTHRLIFASTMLVWVNLALWVYTLAVRNRVGEQRVLRAVAELADSPDAVDS
ncbi:MAG: hypothetical protein AAF989_08955 [Planctomycetota bacterium]